MDRVAEEIGHDGWIAARRQLEAMTETVDVETRLSLWRAAKRYAQRAREESETRQAGEAAASLARPLEGGSVRGARDW